MMETTLKPYRASQDTGLDWIGDIPAHWEVSRNGRLFSQRITTGRPELPVLEVSLKTGVRVRDLEGGARKQAMSNRSQYKVAIQGDIAYNMMRMWQGAVGVAPVDGLISPAYVIAQPRPGTVTHYYAYLFRTHAYMEEVNRRSRGIVSDRNRLYWQDFKQIPSLAPPPDEQIQIANFLDAHGRAVNRLIRAKQRLIALLNEQKQAIIQRAVTRGLDTDLALKPSGVDWLGEVPEHWRVIRLKVVTALNDSGVWGTTFSSEGTPVLRSTEQTIDGRWRIDDPARIVLSDTDRQTSLLRAGDLVITKSSGSPAHIGKTTVVTEEIEEMGCCFSNFMQRIRLNDAADPHFVWYVLNSPIGREQYKYWTNSTTGLGNLNGTIIGSVQFALPNVEEQKDIINYLSVTLRPIDESIGKAYQEIHLIREYRTRLIADVVTGKLDVRGVEVPEIEDSGPDEYAADADDGGVEGELVDAFEEVEV